MINRKPIAILSTSSTLHNLSCRSSSSTSLGSRTRYGISRQQPRRKYATIASALPSPNDSPRPSFHWPSATPPASLPTPYQILSQDRSAPYTKHRYYELVKIYHPDRSIHEKHLSTHLCDLSPAVRLERYRLIVTAHEILSDPVKRGAYDAWGAGWAGAPSIRIGPYGRHRRRSKEEQGEYEDGPFRNATWEDWERWRARHDAPPQQKPVYVSNVAFVALIAMFAAVGGVGQATRAERSSASFLEQRDLVHNETSKELMRLRREAKGHLREEQIEAFVRSRDAAMGEIRAAEESEARKLLADVQFCSSEDVARRSSEFWDRKERGRRKDE